MIDGVRAAKRVIVVAEEIVAPEVIASDPNRTVIPGFLVNAVVECPYGAHPSPVQGYYNRDNDFFREYHEQTKTKLASDAWLDKWVRNLPESHGHAAPRTSGEAAGIRRSHRPPPRPEVLDFAAPQDSSIVYHGRICLG